MPLGAIQVLVISFINMISAFFFLPALRPCELGLCFLVFILTHKIILPKQDSNRFFYSGASIHLSFTFNYIKTDSTFLFLSKTYLRKEGKQAKIMRNQIRKIYLCTIVDPLLIENKTEWVCIGKTLHFWNIYSYIDHPISLNN